MWALLGEDVPSGVAAAAWGDFEVEIFAVFRDGQVWNRYWDGTDWHEWKPMGGEFTGHPAAAARDADRIDVFAIDTRGLVNHRFWDGTEWVDWRLLDGAPEGAEGVACSWVKDRLDVFVWGADGRVWYRPISV